MTDKDAIALLRGNPSDFAQSLCSQFDRHGRLSDKQWHWVIKLAGEAEVRAARATEPVATAEKLGNFADMVKLFSVASDNGLKFPKVQLEADADQPVVLARCGNGSKYPGAIRVTNGAGYNSPDNQYYGMINQQGSWLPGRDANPAVVNILRAFAADPAGVAAAYGIRTGNCCFCRRELSDERSTSVGYGPICADKYGLAWG
jgi:hypothetical protein